MTMILGICNRTENWGTARRMFAEQDERTVKLLLKRLCDPGSPGVANMELFWRGYRDYCFQHKITRNSSKNDELIGRYNTFFPQLRKRIERFCVDHPNKL